MRRRAVVCARYFPLHSLINKTSPSGWIVLEASYLFLSILRSLLFRIHIRICLEFDGSHVLMAKNKAAGGVHNRALYSRASFLYQAAALCAETQQPQQDAPSVTEPQAPAQGRVSPSGGVHGNGSEGRGRGRQAPLQGMSRHLLTDLRSVSLKTMIRLTPGIKRTICKYCDTLLMEGKTCTSTVENQSKGAKKPWADVLVITCNTCGGAKRFPVAAPRPPRKTARAGKEAEEQGLPAQP